MASTLGDTDPHNLKLRNGRRLVGEHVVYDVDVGLPGEIPLQPEEVTQITNDGSDPQLVVPMILDMQQKINQSQQEMQNQLQEMVKSQQEMQSQLQEMLNSQQEMVKSQQEMQEMLSQLQEMVKSLQEMVKSQQKMVNSQQEMVKSQQEMVKSQQEMVNSQQKMVKSQQEMQSQLSNAENMIDSVGARFEEEIKKTMSKEIARVALVLARQTTPIIEQAVVSAITESFQRGIGDKAVNQLDKSVNPKLETCIARQVQAQFQTSDGQPIQEALMSSLESLFQKAVDEHTSAAQQQFRSEFSHLAHTLMEVAEALAECQRSLVALVVDHPTILLSKLISERNYDEAFKLALQKNNAFIVSWLCSQVDLRGLLAMNPLPLNQSLLLSLLQQLASDISKDTSRKLGWMSDVVKVINPSDQLIEIHARRIFEQVYQNLQDHLVKTQSIDFTAMRLMMHVISNLLMRCK